MRYAIALAALLLPAAPAIASGSVECDVTDGSNLRVIVGGMLREPGSLPSYAQVQRGETILLGTRTEPPGLAIGAYRDIGRVLSFDLVHPRTRIVLARIWALNDAEGGAAGTLFYGGSRHPVRCLFG